MTGLEKWNKEENNNPPQTIEQAIYTILDRDENTGVYEFSQCRWCLYDGSYCGGWACESGIEMYLTDEIIEE